MRLIDKLILKFTKPEKYVLLPPIALNFLPKEKNLFTYFYDKNLLRAAVFNRNGEPILEPFEKFSPEGISEEEAVELLRNYISNLEDKKLKTATYIPVREGMLRLYTYPATLTESEMLKSLKLYIQQEISELYSDKEVIYKYTFLPRIEEEPYKILAAIVEINALNKIKNFAAKLGIELDIVSYEPICILNFAYLKGLTSDFSILYTDYTKLILLAYNQNRILYEVFYYNYSPNLLDSEEFNNLIWNIRNYIVINDLSNIFLTGLYVENPQIVEIIMDKLPIFGILSLESVPDRFTLLYTLSARLAHA